jgi:hypothetical protein
MTIRNNRFFYCNEPVVNINPRNSASNDSVHQNIRIKDNEFILRRGTAVKAKSTKGLTVTGNTIYSEQQLDESKSIQTINCSDIKIDNNKFLPLPAKG